MTKRQLVPARIIKFWLDLSLVLGIVGGALITLGWLLAPLMDKGSSLQYEIELPVALGEYPAGPWRSVLPLEVGPYSTLAIAQPRVVDASGELRFDSDNALMHFTVNSIWVFGVLVVLCIVFLLRRIFQSVIDGEPFSLANASRLRAIGIIIMVAGVLFPLAQYLTAKAVLSRVAVDGIPLNPPFSFELDMVVLGLMLVALSTVFTHGARLEHDQSLTV